MAVFMQAQKRADIASANTAAAEQQTSAAQQRVEQLLSLLHKTTASYEELVSIAQTAHSALVTGGSAEVLQEVVTKLQLAVSQRAAVIEDARLATGDAGAALSPQQVCSLTSRTLTTKGFDQKHATVGP